MLALFAGKEVVTVVALFAAWLAEFLTTFVACLEGGVVPALHAEGLACETVEGVRQHGSNEYAMIRVIRRPASINAQRAAPPGLLGGGKGGDPAVEAFWPRARREQRKREEGGRVPQALHTSAQSLHSSSTSAMQRSPGNYTLLVMRSELQPGTQEKRHDESINALTTREAHFQLSIRLALVAPGAAIAILQAVWIEAVVVDAGDF